VIVVFTVPLLDKLKIDDVVGAIPVHLFAGIWGTLLCKRTTPDFMIAFALANEAAAVLAKQLLKLSFEARHILPQDADY
jgi:ammonia channel protein AmtB